MQTKHIVLSTILAAGLCLDSAAQILVVQSNNPQPVSTGFDLVAGQSYLVRASGTFIYNTYVSDGSTFLGDAEWTWNQATKDGSWIELWPHPYTDSSFVDLLIVGQETDWMGTADPVPGPNSLFQAHTYSPSHVYETTIVGQGAPISFVVSDTHYEDNRGNLTVAISVIPEPATLGLLSLGAAILVLRRKSA
jgi:hypothetical protein